ncbi:MAG: hypothetical protein HOV97_05615 [Nonomuraea sp.]|nr:hypothetical protein [Nonomuraea sp.]
MPKAAPSNRAYEHCTLSFGLITLPLSVYTGVVSDHGIKRGMFTSAPVMESVVDDETGEVVEKQKIVTITKDDGTTEEQPVFEDHPVGYGNIDKVTGELVPPGQAVIKKVATEYGHVYVEDHEIESLFSVPPKTITVKEFQPQHLFYQGNYVPRSLYHVQVTPTKIGSRKVPNETAERNLAVILAAMRAHNAMAVVEFTTRGVPKPGVLLPNGTLWLVYHTDELREQKPLPDIDVPREVADAAFKQYLEPLWGEEPLDLTDERTNLIQNFADDKAREGDFGKSEEVAAPAAAAPDANDIMALLMSSVEQAKAQSA